MLMKSTLRSLAMTAAFWAAIALTACGGGDPLPVQAGTVIGAAGGTVTGPNGAQVVIPAGALASDVTIAVTQSSAGAPAMPGSFTAFGQTYAFTPHGTTFAVPVTITVPFDPSMVPAGRTPLLYKTNAQSQWELVANATVSAGNLTAQVSSFSWTATGTIPLVIDQQPINATVVAPATASFTVVGSGGVSPTLQWERFDVGTATWGPVQTGTGGTTATYTTAATTLADNGARFRVVISDTQGQPAINSNEVTLTVTTGIVAPTITTQPRATSANAGSSATFSVVATGTSLAYQWRFNGTPIAGQTSASLTLTNVQTVDAGSYTVVVSNLVNGSHINSVTSIAATLTVSAGTVMPTITTQPQATTATVGSNATFSVVADGTDLVYQWYFNGITGAIPGATAASLTLTNVQTGNAGSYMVVVSNLVNGSPVNGVASIAATLTVNAVGCAVTIGGTGQPHLQTDCFDVSSSRIEAGVQLIWADLPDDVEILLVQTAGSATAFDTIYVYRPLAQGRIWSRTNIGGIPGIVRTGNQVTLTSVSVPELMAPGATTLTLSGVLTAP